MTRRHATVIMLVWALLTLRDATPSLADDTDRLIGTWKLVSAVSEELATGQKTNLYEGAPIGFITYGADGRVMTVIVDSPRKKPAGAVATAVEAEALFRSMAAYAGTYTIKGKSSNSSPRRFLERDVDRYRPSSRVQIRRRTPDTRDVTITESSLG